MTCDRPAVSLILSNQVYRARPWGGFLPLQSAQSRWPTWGLQTPPSGVDGRRWSLTWFVPSAVNGWAMEDERVRAACAELAIADYGRCDVHAEVLDGDDLLLHIFGALDRPMEPEEDAYVKPVKQVAVPANDALAVRLRYFLALRGPAAPVDELLTARSRSHYRPLVQGTSDATSREEYFRALRPFLALDVLRRHKLTSGALRNRQGVPLRKRLLALLRRSDLPYRVPRNAGRQLTDMSPVELDGVVKDASFLIAEVRAHPAGLWPLLPGELDRILRPPPVGRYTAGCWSDVLVNYPEDVPGVRSDQVLAHDLTLLRLGYRLDAWDPGSRDSEDVLQARNALLVQLSRARARLLPRVALTALNVSVAWSVLQGAGSVSPNSGMTDLTGQVR